MRDLFRVEEVNPKHFRRRTGPQVEQIYGSVGDETCGAFIGHRAGKRGPVIFNIVVSSDGVWEHVSITTNEKRCPTWEEMAYFAGLIFFPHEVLVQYRPAASDYVNNHPTCLHWWRYVPGIPTPPVGYV